MIYFIEFTVSELLECALEDQHFGYPFLLFPNLPLTWCWNSRCQLLAPTLGPFLLLARSALAEAAGAAARVGARRGAAPG